MSPGEKWNYKAFSTKTKNKINFQMEVPIKYNNNVLRLKTRIYLIIRLITFKKSNNKQLFQHLENSAYHKNYAHNNKTPKFPKSPTKTKKKLTNEKAFQKYTKSSFHNGFELAYQKIQDPPNLTVSKTQKGLF